MKTMESALADTREEAKHLGELVSDQHARILAMEKERTMTDRIWLALTYLVSFWLLAQVYLAQDRRVMGAYFICLIAALLALIVQATALAMREHDVTSTDEARRTSQTKDTAQK